MAPRKKLDADDEDFIPRRGRPPYPDEPPRPEPWERAEFATRVQEILDALEIVEIDRDVRLELQRRLWRADRLRRLLGICTNGEADIVLLLRTINESANGQAALTLPVITAVSLCSHEVWTSKGLAWIEAFDQIPLLQILQTVRDLGLEEHYSTALRHRLMKILGPPIAPKPPVPKKPPAKKVKPPDVSQETWDAVLAMHKNRKKRPKARMAA